MTPSRPQNRSVDAGEKPAFKVRLKDINAEFIDWPEDSDNRFKANIGQLDNTVLERLLLVKPPIVVKQASGRYVALNNLRAIVQSLDVTRANTKLRIRCLILDNDEWDPDTWRAFIDIGVPYISGRITSVQKRHARKILKQNGHLGGITKSLSRATRAKGMTQAKRSD